MHGLLQECVIVDGSSGVDNGVENNLWYFREDIFLNGDHMFYHHSYPTEEATNREDRRAELFYYFHREALARFHINFWLSSTLFLK